MVAEAVAAAPATRKRRLSELPVPDSDPSLEDAAAAAAIKRAKGVPSISEAVAIVRATRSDVRGRA